MQKFANINFRDEKEKEKFKKDFPKILLMDVEVIPKQGSGLSSIVFFKDKKEIEKFSKQYPTLGIIDPFSILHSSTKEKAFSKIENLADKAFNNYSNCLDELIGCHKELREKLFDKMKDNSSTMGEIETIRDKLNLIEELLDQMGFEELLEISIYGKANQNKSKC